MLTQETRLPEADTARFGGVWWNRKPTRSGIRIPGFCVTLGGLYPVRASDLCLGQDWGVQSQTYGQEKYADLEPAPAPALGR